MLIMHSINPAGCIFCHEIKEQQDLYFILTDNFAVKWDPAPVRQGHALIIPKAHIGSIVELQEKVALEFFRVLHEVIGTIEERFHPAGFNFGSNIGDAAGQTIYHAHVHVIPRYTGDHPNPKGGIRNIGPEYIPPASIKGVEQE